MATSRAAVSSGPTNRDWKEKSGSGQRKHDKNRYRKSIPPRVSCRTDILHLGPSPAVPVNQPKANHSLYGSLAAAELPKPREESRMLNLGAGTCVTGHTQGVQSIRVPGTTKSVMTRLAEPLRPRTVHAPKLNATAHQETTRSSATSDLMIPYGTFEGSFHKVAPTKTRKVAFKEEERSLSSWSTVVSGDLET